MLTKIFAISWHSTFEFFSNSAKSLKLKPSDACAMRTQSICPRCMCNIDKWHSLCYACALMTRVSDPDPHGSALIWVAGSGSRRAKMTHKNRIKSRIFMFLSTGCSHLRAESFSCSLGVLYGGLGISKLQFLIKKIEIKFPALNFFQF